MHYYLQYIFPEIFSQLTTQKQPAFSKKKAGAYGYYSLGT